MNWLRGYVKRYKAVIGYLILAAGVILAVAIGVHQANENDAEREDRIEAVAAASYRACERANIGREEIRFMAETLRGIVVLVVRAAPPVGQMTYERRVLHEQMKEAARELAKAVRRLEPIDCVQATPVSEVPDDRR